MPRSKARRKKATRRYKMLPKKRVLAIRAALKRDKAYGRQSRVAKRFRIDQSTVCRIDKRESYASVR